MTRAKTKYRILGANGDWFAWHEEYSNIPLWLPHIQRYEVKCRGEWIAVDGCIGRTPGEALYRLQSLLRKHYRIR